jgi:pimeloyl-ACP methyl ester carboxylesterase
VPGSARFQVCVGVVLLLCAYAAAAPLGAQAALSFAPCPSTNVFACTHLTVPLDPTGQVPGTVSLAIRRKPSPTGPSSDAVIALAGGPGQAAVPLAEDFVDVLGPVVSTRDLIVFDQRGTGESGPLHCSALESFSSPSSIGSLVKQCAEQIGPARGLYTTAESVADIEAIREAGGYEKLVLYGTSYGTKVAEQYAQTYPTHVEALILDSVVAPNGPDVLARSTFAAVPRVLSQLCAAGACDGITSNPVADLAALVKRTRAHPLLGRAIGHNGKAHTIHVSSADLLGMLVAGDLDPFLRAEFPASIHSALHGDDAPLARLLYGVINAGEGGSGDGIDEALNLDTSCEELSYPWDRAANAQARLSQAKAQIAALPAASIAPFQASDVLAAGEIPLCAFWPFASPAPLINNAPLPSVPTLILSGADDLRTPNADARAVAAQIPGSHLLVVPNTGHSVLGSDPSTCSLKALETLFANTPILSCPSSPAPAIMRPTPLAPMSLTDIRAAQGSHGRAGRTLEAVGLTLSDMSQQLIVQFANQRSSESLPSKLTVGGLRGGWLEDSRAGLVLHKLSYIPGVTVSGMLAGEQGTLHVGGSAASAGVLSYRRNNALSGTLGGHRVYLNDIPFSTKQAAQEARLARAGRLGAPTLG